MTDFKKIELIYQIFSPSAPIENIEFFVGRHVQIQKIRDAIEERGQHVVMYGRRGVGKTSIANILNDLYENIIYSKVTCTRTDNFLSIWDKALQNIQIISTEKGIGFTQTEQTIVNKLRLPRKKHIDAYDIAEIFKEIQEYIVIVFDEFDAIVDTPTKVKIADTLKVLSDNVPQVTIVIVGIAESVDELIGEHKSLERCIKQVHVPEMDSEESKILVKNCLKQLDLSIDKSILNRIVEYSSGYPHYIHLLSKFASKNAIQNQSEKIKLEHFDLAVQESIENSDHSIKSSFQKAIFSSKDKNQFEDVVYASTLATTDEQNSFTTTEVLEKLIELTKKEIKKESIHYNLGMLCKEERGVILQKIGSNKNKRYRFSNPLLKVFIKLKFHNKSTN